MKLLKKHLSKVAILTPNGINPEGQEERNQAEIALNYSTLGSRNDSLMPTRLPDHR